MTSSRLRAAIKLRQKPVGAVFFVMAKLGFDFKAENLHLFGIYIVKSIKRGKARVKSLYLKILLCFIINCSYSTLSLVEIKKKKEIEKCYFCHLTVGGFNNIVICK